MRVSVPLLWNAAPCLTCGAEAIEAALFVPCPGKRRRPYLDNDGRIASLI